MQLIPYSRHEMTQQDIDAAVKVLESGQLTKGPAVNAFEAALCDFTGAKHAVALSSGTAALHAAMEALGLLEGDEVIVPSLTFAATVNAIEMAGGTPVFVDVDPKTLCIDPKRIEDAINPLRTVAVVTVDYAGNKCDYRRIKPLCQAHELTLVADACHSFGSRDVGNIADITCFSFHPAKLITTGGEGGAVVTNDPMWAQWCREFRDHGITKPLEQRMKEKNPDYNISTPGLNYRMTDMQAAIGLSQIERANSYVYLRRKIAKKYATHLAKIPGVTMLKHQSTGAVNLLVIELDASIDRRAVYLGMHDAGVHVAVHYPLVHKMDYYASSLVLPVSEQKQRQILTLPLFTTMTDEQIIHVCETLDRVISNTHRSRNAASPRNEALAS